MELHDNVDPSKGIYVPNYLTVALVCVEKRCQYSDNCSDEGVNRTRSQQSEMLAADGVVK